MKNEIGRKLTSLTIMAIMFAGGMTLAVPGFMPQTQAAESTSGLLTVSTTTLQGAAILEIVANDPDINNVADDIAAPTVDVGSETYTMTQATNGKWYLYVVDKSTASTAEAQETGLEFGILCTSGIGGVGVATTDIDSSDAIYAEAIKTANSQGVTQEGGCEDLDGAVETTDDAASTVAREKMTDAVLTDAPTLSDPNGDQSNLGQRIHVLNASGHGTWPYIIAQDLNDDNIIAYGDDSINVEFGNTDDETSIFLSNPTPGANAEIHVTVVDPALNIDPTGADIWQYDLSDNDANRTTVEWAKNGTLNTAFTEAQLSDLGFGDNGNLATGSEGILVPGNSTAAPNSTSCCTVDTVIMTESGSNTDVFESFDLNGNAQLKTAVDAAVDTVILWSYGGDTVDMIITYDDASLSMDAGGDWVAGTAIPVSVTDGDANKNPTSEETLSIGDPLHVIPTIKVGSPLTLGGGYSGDHPNMQTGDVITSNSTCMTTWTAALSIGVNPCPAGVRFGTTAGGADYGLNVYNTSDNSERLRIIMNGTTTGAPESANASTTFWLNITTGHTKADLTNLEGTPVLSYDVTALADLISSTAISVHVLDTPVNSTWNSAGDMLVESVGNAKSGVVDLSDNDQYIVNRGVTAGGSTFSSPQNAGTSLISLAFKFTVGAAQKGPASDADFAVSADFCNFDQNNGSLVHNCIYRLEGVESGPNTGVFEGTVEYVLLNNSTSGQGGQDGNDIEVEGLLGYVKGDALSVVMMDAASGSDAIRLVYNDTDSFQTSGGDKKAVQLDAITHTGTVDLDAESYGADDFATITIVDPDLNQDSAIRDTYTNSSTTFQVTYTGDSTASGGQLTAAAQTILETGPDTGVFVGTFLVPDNKGFDMELVYYESKDAGSNALEYYDTARIVSNSGSISLDRSVYPVPFTAGTLQPGSDATTSIQEEAGEIVVWMTVTDADETGDTLTTTSGAGTGTITLSIAGDTCFTAGSETGKADAGTAEAELGPLVAVDSDFGTYEISATVVEETDCGAANVSVKSGDVLQASYVDSADDAGVSTTFFDSATFDLRTATLTTDKDVYVMGSDMVVTLTDPDLNFDSASTESFAMSILEWDSAADSSELLATSSSDNTSTSFTSNPSSIQETGDNTGVFQTVVTLPTDTVGSGDPEYGEAVTLTYVDVGLSGEDRPADDSSDIETTFSISNFGAIVELDKALYTWTDTVYITITAPDHNNNSAAEETIGTSSLPIQVTSRAGKMCTSSTTSSFYTASETGIDTGVFTADVDLRGYSSASPHNTPANQSNACDSSANTDGRLITGGQTDGVSVSFEYTNNVVIVASASIAWNIAETAFDTSSASAGGSAVITVTDDDENTNTDVIEDFTVDVYSDSDNGGVTVTLTETDEDTGVFEATVFFTATDATSGTNLRVSEGDTVTVEYTDKTLPEPYTDSDTLTIASTLTIGTAFPPLERAPAANARVVDAFGASVAEVSVDQQVQIAADVSNGQSTDQAFAYLVQVQDSDGVTVSLAWITGSLTAGQSMSPALSWTPSSSGSYTATVFVWESVDNPTALSPTTSVDIDVV